MHCIECPYRAKMSSTINTMSDNIEYTTTYAIDASHIKLSREPRSRTYFQNKNLKEQVTNDRAGRKRLTFANQFNFDTFDNFR